MMISRCKFHVCLKSTRFRHALSAANLHGGTAPVNKKWNSMLCFLTFAANSSACNHSCIHHPCLFPSRSIDPRRLPRRVPVARPRRAINKPNRRFHQRSLSILIVRTRARATDSRRSRRAPKTHKNVSGRHVRALTACVPSPRRHHPARGGVSTRARPRDSSSRRRRAV